MTLLEQCQKWFKEGEVDKIEEVVMSLSEEERTPELLSELGRVWIYRSADSMIEEECCNRAIEILKPLEQDLSDNHNYQYRMGMAYEGLQQYQPAKAHFEKALELLPDDEDTIAMIELCDRMMGGISLEPWERFSIMRGVYPKGKENFFEENLRERLDSLDDVKCVAFEYSEEENAVAFKVIYQDNEYDFDMFMDGFDSDIIFELQRKYFTKEDEREISSSDTALVLYTEVQKNPLETIHLQIKLLYALVPDMLAIYAESQECMLNKREIAMVAQSKAGLRPMDLYRVQAVEGPNGDVWLHTHGLMPLGITELEILGADKDSVDSMFSLINSVASQMIEDCYEDEDEKAVSFFVGNCSNGEPIEGCYNEDEEKPVIFFAGNCSNGEPIVTTVVPWMSGIKEYEEDGVQGLEEDRQSSHNTYTSLIFLYRNEEDFHNEILTKPASFAEKIGENPLFMFGTKTTEIMAAMARERVSYPQRALQLQQKSQDEDIRVIAKIAVDVMTDEGEEAVEHVWFTIDRITEKEISGILLQELFGNGGIVPGDRGTYPLSQLTDWSISFKGVSIDSRVAYLFDILQNEEL